MLARQRSERLAGANFQKYPRRIAEQFGEPFGEAHSVSQVLRPIRRICGFGSCDPRAGDIREVGNLGGAQRNFGEMGAEGLEHWIHHRGMKCMRRVQQTARDGSFLQLLRELLNGIAGARDHALLGPVDRGQCQFCWK